MGTSLSIQSEAVPSLCSPQLDTDTSAKNGFSALFKQDGFTPSSIQTQSSTVKSNLPTTGASFTATTPCISDAPAREPDPIRLCLWKSSSVMSRTRSQLMQHWTRQFPASPVTNPTIFLSSPAKTLPATSAVITQEETAQAVSCLQGAEGVGSSEHLRGACRVVDSLRWDVPQVRKPVSFSCCKRTPPLGLQVAISS